MGQLYDRYPPTHRHQIPIGRCCSTSDHPPRFRSLAIFERRPTGRADTFVIDRRPKIFTESDSRDINVVTIEPSIPDGFLLAYSITSSAREPRRCRAPSRS
jgi:hypothetical protein